MNEKSYEHFFINFANKTRLKIILCLKDKPKSVSRIVDETREEQSSVSHHLKQLLNCHIVTFKKRGKERIYSLNEKTVSHLLEIVEMHIRHNCAINCGKKCRGCCR